MYSKTTKVIFNIIIISILCVGFFAGIFAGDALREENHHYLRGTVTMDWSFQSTIAMISIWTVSFLTAAAYYGLHKIIQILDSIRKNTEKE